VYLVQRSRGETGLVPSGPVTAHLKRVLASGRTITQIAKETGLSPQTVRDHSVGRRPALVKSKADVLLAVAPTADPYGLVDATGTMRRMRAMVAMGHPQTVLAAEVGCAYTYTSTLLHGQRATVTVSLDQAVQRTYAKLSMTVGPSVQARLKAQRLGWHGPLAWDEDTISDRRAVPQTDAQQPVATEGENVAARWLLGESVILGREDRREVLQYLFEWTSNPPEDIAARLDMSPEAASRAWERIKEKALADGRRVWRRTYVPRLKQNDLEEVA
jgi:hypothetical protein